MTTEDAVVEQYKTLVLHLQEVIRSYYEGDIAGALDHLNMAKNRFDAVRYHLFQTTHKSGERG